MVPGVASAIQNAAFDQHLKRGEYDLQHSRPGSAVLDFEAAAELAPGDAVVQYDLAKALRAWGDAGGAEAALSEALRLRPDFPEAHFLLGLIQGDNSGDSHRALNEFNITIAEDPSFAEAYYNAGIIFWKADQNAVALKFFDTAVRLRPRNVEFAVRYGETLERLGKLKEAQTQFERAVALDPANRQAFYELAMIEERLGDKAAAAQTLRTVKRLQGSTASLPEERKLEYNEGLRALQRGQSDVAIQKLTLALRAGGDEETIRNGLAIGYGQKGNSAAALEQLQQILRLDPGSPDAHLNLGVALMREGDRAGAQAEFLKAAAANPYFAEAYYNLGLLAAAQRRWSDALELMNKAVRLSPGDARADWGMARVLRDSGKPAESLAYFAKACHLDPALIQAKLDYARALQSQGQRTDAIAVLQEGMQMDPANPELYNALEGALADAGQAQRAAAERRDYERLVTGSNPGQPSEYQRGIAALNAGIFREAAADFESVLAGYPSLASVRRKLAFAEFAAGDYRGAVAQYERLSADGCTDAELHLDFGIALLRAGSLDEARKELEAAIRLNPASASAHYHLGLVLFGQNKRADALQQFHEALRIDPSVKLPIRATRPVN